MFRRSLGIPPSDDSRTTFFPATNTSPVDGSSSRSSRRSVVDLPEPDGPTTKTNSPFSISIETASRAITPFLYVLVTFWRLIMSLRRWGRLRDRPTLSEGRRASVEVHHLSASSGGAPPELRFDEAIEVPCQHPLRIPNL